MYKLFKQRLIKAKKENWLTMSCVEVNSGQPKCVDTLLMLFPIGDLLTFLIPTEILFY